MFNLTTRGLHKNFLKSQRKIYLNKLYSNVTGCTSWFRNYVLFLTNINSLAETRPQKIGFRLRVVPLHGNL